MPPAIAVLTTTATKPDAERIARTLVEQRLAACVQISGPLTSCYRWKGAIETAEEWLCTIKTTAGSYPAVEAAIRQVHPYEEPEIVALPILTGSPGYLAWLTNEVAEQTIPSTSGLRA